MGWGDRELQAEACPGQMAAGLRQHRCPAVRYWWFGVFAMLAVRSSEEYPGCGIIIFEDQMMGAIWGPAEYWGPITCAGGQEA